MDRRETEHLLDAIRKALQAGSSAALATIVRVRGSAYRREGMRMLVREDGTYECALSGGCLEPSVAEVARRVMATGEPTIVAYDLADDSLWGLGMGCSGAVDILIEHLDERFGRDEVMLAWLDVLQRGASATLVTALDGAIERRFARMLVLASGDRRGSLGDVALDREAAERARGRMAATFSRSGAERLGHRELFFDVSTPPPSIVVFGAGLDAIPLVRQAWMLGFSVTVVDVRSAHLTTEAFPHATLVPAHFSEFRARVPIHRDSCLVVMNHHLERDRESLRFALESDAAYIGVLGPRVRYQKLLAELAAAGFTPSSAQVSRVRSPIGLSLGAETPEEVALSILGEILAVQRGRAGGFLDGSSHGLHEPDATRALVDK